LKLPRLGFLSIVVLLAQLLFGVAASLWVTIGADRPWSHISDVALFAAHGVLGALAFARPFLPRVRGGSAAGPTRPPEAVRIEEPA
jgi:hypothetical protein